MEIFLYLIGGLLALFLGGEGLIRGSSSLSLRIGISPLVVGLTVVAFGTSSPELLVSIKAALMGNSSIALGNVIGSNIANIALILGISSIIRPLQVHANVIRREIPIMIGTTILLIIFLSDGNLNFTEGIVFLILLIAYTSVNIFLSIKENKEIEKEFEEGLKSKLSIPVSTLFIVFGLALLFFGADLFLKGAVALAKIFNVSDAVIGLTVVAVGTSLPEMFTSIVATIKKESDIAVGNAVGSNIFNILSILGISSLIVPISSGEINYLDFGVMLAAALILLPLSYTNLRISRLEGALLLVGYIAYLFILV
ncbi:Inorganic ion transporter [Ignavibacterium album JCM 16511]|uniref:Inorganic ion transporter n=1 Tax=Ignavibacterium album (strain DSM 19864 / JCM 16511 / NBRC 101810 / Mat9-16) TaxID=945713 RepID=I0APF6_IGNAJ|nr:calcium/sodium antiporter [Ignavibacterium album]AFH50863.1 Inorganic ion transporter [Ignavibacterium album JCM 16511]